MSEDTVENEHTVVAKSQESQENHGENNAAVTEEPAALADQDDASSTSDSGDEEIEIEIDHGPKLEVVDDASKVDSDDASKDNPPESESEDDSDVIDDAMDTDDDDGPKLEVVDDATKDDFDADDEDADVDSGDDEAVEDKDDADGDDSDGDDSDVDVTDDADGDDAAEDDSDESVTDDADAGGGDDAEDGADTEESDETNSEADEHSEQNLTDSESSMELELDIGDIETEESPGAPPPLPSADAVPAAVPMSRRGRVSTQPPPTPAVPESQSSRVPKRPWFETFFGEDYLRTVRMPTSKQVARECDFILDQLDLKPGATLLDLGCGLGLHAIELTHRGYLVVGIDLSHAMHARAVEEASDHGLSLNFLQGDMRDMTFEGTFDAVLCWGTSFGYFDEPGHRKTLQNIFDALQPGGHLVLDIVNRDYVIAEQPNLVWYEGQSCVCMEETKFNHDTSQLEVSRNVMIEGEGQYDRSYAIRIFSFHEIKGLLASEGFRITATSGNLSTPDVFFGAHSPRLILRAERNVSRA